MTQAVENQVTKLPLGHKIRKIGMICFAKHGLTEGLYILKKEEFSITCYMCDKYTRKWPSIFIRDKPILSSEMMFHRLHDSKYSFRKKNTAD
jgi:hypothetical protein